MGGIWQHTAFAMGRKEVAVESRAVCWCTLVRTVSHVHRRRLSVGAPSGMGPVSDSQLVCLLAVCAVSELYHVYMSSWLLPCEAPAVCECVSCGGQVAGLEGWHAVAAQACA